MTSSSDAEELMENFEDRSPPSGQTNHALIRTDRMPKIVLRRISTLTYPGISWRSPSQSSQSDGLSPQFGCSSGQSPIPSPNRFPEVNSPPCSQPGPSNSTPTTSKSRQLRRSPRCSPIHTANYYPTKNQKRKALPIMSDDEVDETPSRLVESPTSMRRKKAARNLRCLTPRSEESSTEIEDGEKRRSKSISD